jgi:hypothetical protein
MPRKQRKGDDVVADAILAQRRIDADRKGDDPHEQQGAEGDERRHPQAVPDEIGHRRPVFERYAEVAMEGIADPAQILKR